MGLLSKASAAIDGSKFKAVNNRDKNYTSAKIERRRKQLEESVSRYLSQLDTADRQDPSETLPTRMSTRSLTQRFWERSGALSSMMSSLEQRQGITTHFRAIAKSWRGQLTLTLSPRI